MRLHVNLINYKTWLINQLIYHKGSIRFWKKKKKRYYKIKFSQSPYIHLDGIDHM